MIFKIALISSFTLITLIYSVSLFFSSPVLAQTIPTCGPTEELTFDPTAGYSCIPKGTGGSNNSLPAIGKITNTSLPSAAGNENSFVAGVVRNGITLLLIVAFIIDLIWTILAGFQFIFAGGDPKNISTAWSRIYWGLIGMTIVFSSFAIIKIVEIFFHVDLLSGGLKLPTISN